MAGVRDAEAGCAASSSFPGMSGVAAHPKRVTPDERVTPDKFATPDKRVTPDLIRGPETNQACIGDKAPLDPGYAFGIPG